MEQTDRMRIPPRPATRIPLFAGASPGAVKGVGFVSDYRTVATIVVVCLVLLGCAALIGGIVLFIALRRAPDGVEDEEGFHRIDKPKR